MPDTKKPKGDAVPSASEMSEKELAALLDGYQQGNAVRGGGWYQIQAGDVIKGELLGRFEMKGVKNRDGSARMYYQIRLDTPARAMVENPNAKGRDDKYQEVTLPPGETLNVDERAALADMAPLATDGGRYNVIIIVKPKLKLEDNTTFWPMDWHKRVLQHPPAAPAI